MPFLRQQIQALTEDQDRSKYDLSNHRHRAAGTT